MNLMLSLGKSCYHKQPPFSLELWYGCYICKLLYKSCTIPFLLNTNLCEQGEVTTVITYLALAKSVMVLFRSIFHCTCKPLLYLQFSTAFILSSQSLLIIACHFFVIDVRDKADFIALRNLGGNMLIQYTL